METSVQHATEELILSTAHSQPPTPPNPGQRPSYRDVMIDKLARQLLERMKADEQDCGNYVDEGAGNLDTVCIDGYFDLNKLAEAAVDELIDRPEREFQQQLAEVVARNSDADSMGAWVPATAGAWM